MLRELVEMDGAHALHERLHTNTKGLKRLVSRHGPEVLDTIRERLTSFMIDGCPVGKITSWGYFVKAQQDEDFVADLAANDLRPGDFPGWRQFKPTNEVVS
ncbi:MAG: hypothetical protein GY877_10800 [Hyphomicrobium sp.]|nr:hypothetical protein [Hyphomicrobium sp.]